MAIQCSQYHSLAHSGVHLLLGYSLQDAFQPEGPIAQLIAPGVLLLPGVFPGMDVNCLEGGKKHIYIYT